MSKPPLPKAEAIRTLERAVKVLEHFEERDELGGVKTTRQALENYKRGLE